MRTVGTFLLASWPRRLVLGSLLLIPCLVLAFGGFREAEPETFDVAAGSAVDLGPAVYRPTAFFVSAEMMRSDLARQDAVAWLGVVVEIENLTDEQLSLTFPGPASEAVIPVLEPDVRVDAVTSVPAEALRISDGSAGRASLPGVPSRVAYLWPISDDAAIGDTLTILMREQIWTYGPLSGEDTWLAVDDSDTWRMDLPRTQLPPALYQPPEDD